MHRFLTAWALFKGQLYTVYIHTHNSYIHMHPRFSILRHIMETHPCQHIESYPLFSVGA